MVPHSSQMDTPHDFSPKSETIEATGKSNAARFNDLAASHLRVADPCMQAAQKRNSAGTTTNVVTRTYSGRLRRTLTSHWVTSERPSRIPHATGTGCAAALAALLPIVTFPLAILHPRHLERITPSAESVQEF